MTTTKPAKPIPGDVEQAAAVIVDAALQVHKALGPGLLESVYEACLCHELAQRNVRFERQVDLPIRYGGHLTYLKLSGLRLGLLTNFNVIRMRDGIKRVVL